MPDSTAHYYAGGKKIALEADAHLAVDLEQASKSGLSAAGLASVRTTGTELRRDVYLVAADALDAETEESLDRAGALCPVFRDPSGALVVVLPEVRVEVDDDAKGAAVRDEIDSLGDSVEVVRDADGQLVLRPASGRGADALDLANLLFEKAAPAMAQPRLLRVVERPDASQAPRAKRS